MKVYDPAKHSIDSSWLVTLKIDGVQVQIKDGVATSRAGKPLYNIPVDQLPDGTYECYLGDWASSHSAACRVIDAPMVRVEDMYRIDSGFVDETLKFHSRLFHPKELGYEEGEPWHQTSVKYLFDVAVRAGYEGLVLHGPDGTMLKVKTKETHDLVVTQVIGGSGKHLGRMGALVTDRGNVGTGFDNSTREWFMQHAGLIEDGHEAGCKALNTDNERVTASEILFNRKPGVEPGDFFCNCERTGFLIEVECMSLTPGGKLRHPRFVRTRPDKRVDGGAV